MAKKQSKQAGKREKVTFKLDANHTKEVLIAGDFNEWNADQNPMTQKGDGSWQKSIMLFPGTYEYKFVVDGQWVEDPLNEQRCPNCFGTVNSVIEVAG